ncbi:MAG: hypothetical protein U9Q69_02435 [Nanoarchaeota archaeon]|nr:hypothetical protein [Nanoarchaeota archaeon]
MTLRNRIKIGIASLLVGSALVLGGCQKNVEGTVVEEVTGKKLIGGQIRAYVVRDKESNKYYVGYFNDKDLDPFNVGDCAKLKLEIFSSLNFSYYVNGKKVVEDGYEIIEYSPCKIKQKK